MIGKIMSEAAHSIIGMFSAKPLGMENNVSQSDFGSLLRSPQKQPHFNSEGKAISVLSNENVDVGEINSAAGKYSDTTNVFPFINQSFANKIFSQERIPQNVEKGQSTVDLDDSVRADGVLSLTFNHDVMNNSDVRKNNGFTVFGADGEARQAAPALTSDGLPPQTDVILNNGSQIDIAPTPAAQDVVDGRPVNLKLLPEKTAELTDTDIPHTPQSLGNAVGAEILPASNKGFVELPEQSAEALGGNGSRNNPSPEIKGSQFRSQIGKNSADPEILVSSAKTDMQQPEQRGEVLDGNKLRNHQLQKTEEFNFRSNIGVNTVSDEVFPSSEKGLLQLQSLQAQMRGQTGEPVVPSAKPQKSNEFSGLDAESNDATDKPETGKQAAALSPPGMKSVEQKDARLELGHSGFRSSPRDPSLVVPPVVQNMTVAEGDIDGSVKLDLAPATKNAEKLIEQQPITNSSAQLAVRETIQKHVSFDMSTPQIAERLASEIADVLVTGGTKKFEINPRNLGRMEITFTTRGSTEVIEIQTEHRAAKDIIVQHSQLLQDILKSQGRDDLTFRVDVKENMFASSRSETGNLAQQENRDARDQPARSSQRRQMASPFDSTAENDPASDNSRYA